MYVTNDTIIPIYLSGGANKECTSSNSNKDGKCPVTIGRTNVLALLQRMLVEHGRL